MSVIKGAYIRDFMVSQGSLGSKGKVKEFTYSRKSQGSQGNFLREQ